VSTWVLCLWHVGGTARGSGLARRATFGNVRRLPSGRYQARFTDPVGRKVPAPMTFDTKLDAQAWLATIRADLVRGAWLPADHATTFGAYAATWLQHRTLKPRTRAHYRALLDRMLLPAFASVPMRRLSPPSCAPGARSYSRPPRPSTPTRTCCSRRSAAPQWPTIC
jgi:hypothetical protein